MHAEAAMLIAQMQGMRKAGYVWGSPPWTMASHDGYAFIEVRQTSPECAGPAPSRGPLCQMWQQLACAVGLPQVHLTIISGTDQLVPCSPQYP